MTERPDRDSSDLARLETDRNPQTIRQGRLAQVAELAERQSGVLAWRQLLRLGWTESQIVHELRFERWQSPAPGIVVLNTGLLTDVQREWVGVLHAGSGAAISHLTAARRGGLKWVGGHLIDVLTPKGDLVAPLPGYFFHQTRRPYAAWVMAAADPPRLRIEYAVLLTAERERSIRRGIGILAATVQQQLSTSARLQRAIPTIRKLRHGRTFNLVLGDIAGGAQSFAEIDVGRMCREAGLIEPTRQVVRLDKEGRRRYLDCVWELTDGRVIVREIDGSFHAEVAAWWSDMKRERAVVIQHGTVLRCSTVELRLERADIVDDLRRIGVPALPRFVHAMPA